MTTKSTGEHSSDGRTITPTVIPNPDPSVMTSDAIDRRVDNAMAVVNAELKGMAKAVEVLQSDHTRVPTQMDRAIEGLRNLIESRLDCLKSDLHQVKEYACNRDKDNMEVVSTRLGGMDKALDLLHEQQADRQKVIDTSVHQLQQLHDERFKSIAESIGSLSILTQQQFSSVASTFAEKDKAVSVGLSAQKESAAAQQQANANATEKMEDNFTKLLDQGRELLSEVRRNTELQINDIKSKLDKGEGRSNVLDPSTSTQLDRLAQAISDLTRTRDQHSGGEKTASDSSTRMMAGMGLVIALAVGIGEIIVRLTH